MVGAVRDRGDEAKLRWDRSEAAALMLYKRATGFGDQLQDRADPRAKRFEAARRQDVGAVAGYPDAEDERQVRRADSRLGSRRLDLAKLH